MKRPRAGLPRRTWVSKPRRRVVHDAPLLEGSPAMDAIRALIADVADTDAAVLIRGETGVGKDLVARAIHAASLRDQGPFIKVNCAAIPAGLLESELLGHERGAFTGAHQRKQGQFEQAHHGTIFLDEVGDLPLALQAKLLHVLQDFRFSRVGGHEVIKLETRVIAATNVDLERATARGAFRADLYYRVHVLERVQWNRAEAARVLKVSYKTLLSKISQLELTPGKS